MANMAAMPIYGKNLKTIFFSGTAGPISIKLGISIGDSAPIKAKFYM